MSDLPYHLECFACGKPIEREDELLVLPGGWEGEEKFDVPCHRDCAPDEPLATSI